MLEQKETTTTAKPRIEIKQSFSKDLKDLNEQDLNALINDFRRHKARRLEEMKKINPNFGLEARSNSKDFDRRAVLGFMRSIVRSENNRENALNENYNEAATITDWYLSEQKKRGKNRKV